MKLHPIALKNLTALMLLLTGCQLPTSSPVPETPEPIPPETTATSSPDSALKTQVVAATASPYPRRSLPEFAEQVPTGSSFYQFRERLKQAIRDRDASFIKAIADPNIKITFGTAQEFSSLGFDNPNSLSWQRLERIVTIGCSAYEAPEEVKIGAFQCPHISQASVGDPYMDVYVLGENINVRVQPEENGPVIEALTNELVKADPSGYDRLTDQQREAIETFAGWRAIVTPAGKQGYVSSRYAYLPVGYRARFENKNGAWKMTIFISGD